MMRSYFICASILFLLTTNLIFAQFQNILVGNTINSYEPVEPSIVVNPVDTDQILVFERRWSNMAEWYLNLEFWCGRRSVCIG